MKRLFFFTVFCIFLLVSSCTAKLPQEYGVFIGINEGESDRLEQYKLVVIEPSEFSAMHIEKLHAAGKTVYGYLNIGAVEEYRPYYDQFQELFLGVYEDWPDEQWIDVASPKWQNFIIDELGNNMRIWDSTDYFG